MSMFRSVDVEFQDYVHRLHRANEVFKEEVTYLHRHRMELNLIEQQRVYSVIQQITVRDDQRHSQKVEDQAKQRS